MEYFSQNMHIHFKQMIASDDVTQIANWPPPGLAALLLQHPIKCEI